MMRSCNDLVHGGKPPALAMPRTGKANEMTIRSDTRLRGSDAAIAGRAADFS